MRILVAIEKPDQPKAFQKLGVFYVREDGTMSLTQKHNGHLSGQFIRSGAKALISDPTINWVDYQFGSSPTYRVARISA